MDTVQREQALSDICGTKLAMLSSLERESIFLDWWFIDESDVEFGELPERLRLEMRSKRADLSLTPSDISDPRFDPLILTGLRAQFDCYRNEYLAEVRQELGFAPADVGGRVKSFFECPICSYRTLENRGEFDICAVCFWEDSGHDEPSEFSGPNHMTVGEARSAFRDHGAIADQFLEKLPDDRFRRYERATRD